MIKNGSVKRDVKYILEFVHFHQGLTRAKQKAEAIKDEAIQALSILPDTPARQSLEQLAEFVLNRRN